jgi:ABC-type spermidine/putrescine transport system permease subunit II
MVSSVALAMIAVPVLAQWVEASVQTISAKELQQAQMLGLLRNRLLKAYVFPRLRSLEWRVLGFGFLIGAGDVLVSGILSRDATTLPLLSQQMASRYDFSGLAPIQIFWMLLASGVAVVEWRSQRVLRRFS